MIHALKDSRKCKDAERDETIQVLEQLVGSQSLAGTLERFVMLRRLDVWAVIIVCLWSLSPIGSQMSLRLLEITDTTISSNIPISYFDTQFSSNTQSLNRGHPQYGTFMSDGASGGMYNGPALRTLIGAGAITAKQVLSSPVDQWNNVKVPQLDAGSLAVNASSDSWMPVEKIANKTWISLNGLMVQGFPTSGRSNFTIETSYIEVTCTNIIHLQYNSNNSIIPKDTFKSAGFDLTLVNASQPFGPSVDHVLGSSFLDTSSVYTTSRALGTPANLLYVSNAGIGQRYKIPSTLYTYNCTVTNRKAEAKIDYTDGSCTATHIRPSKDDADSRLKLPFLRVEYQNMLLFIPSSLGSVFSNYASPVDHYLFGSDTPMTVGNAPLSPEALNISAIKFSKRLTTFINTVWQAGLCPYGISLGSGADFTALNTTRDYVPSSTTTATLHQVKDKAQYTVNKSHAIVLLIITIIMLACAIGSLILTLITKAPDTLGYISTMTKDNVHAHVPDGGNTLSGLERARYLTDVKVQLADVNPADDVGHIAFRTIDDAAEAKVGRLSKSRLYY